MKLRIDLLEQLKDEDILEAVVENTHRFKPEPLFSQTGIGSLLSATTEECANEAARSTERIQKALRESQQSGADGTR